MSDDAEVRFLPEQFKKKRAQRKQPAALPSPQQDDTPAEFDEPELPLDPAPAPTPTPAPRAESRDDGKLRDMETKLDRLLSTLEGLQRENADLKRQLAEKDKAPPAPKKPRIEVSIADADLDEKELNEQFPTLLPTVRAIARKEVKAALDLLAPQLERLFAETDEAVGSVRETAQKVVRSSFERSVYAAIPDFDRINQDQAFQTYIDQRAPMQPKGVTIRALLSHAWQNQDVEMIAEVIGAFKAQSAPKPAPARGQQANVDNFVQPATPRSPSAPVRDPASAGKLKQSDWTAARQKLARGELTAAEYAPIRAKFEKAKSEGRLVDDTAAPASAA